MCGKAVAFRVSISHRLAHLKKTSPGNRTITVLPFQARKEDSNKIYSLQNIGLV